MPLPLVTITGNFIAPDNVEIANGTITATLSGYDQDGETTVPIKPITATITNGEYSIALWPNDRGMNNTKYTFSAVSDDASKTVSIPGIIVFEDGPTTMGDLLALSKVIGKLPTLTLMTDPKFAAALAAGTLADGVYLVSDAI